MTSPAPTPLPLPQQPRQTPRRTPRRRTPRNRPPHRYDEATIAPGDDWLRRIESGLATTACVAVCLGPHGLGPVQQEELSSALVAALHDDIRRVVPVLLPGATREHIPQLLRHRSFVDLTRFYPQDGPAPPQLARLIELAGLDAAPSRSVAAQWAPRQPPSWPQNRPLGS